MNKDDMLNELFAATIKLEFMQIMLDALIDAVEKEEDNSYLMVDQKVAKNFLYTVDDYINDIIQILDRLQRGGAGDE